MPILQRSDDRLRLACVCLRHAGAFLDLDRSKDRGEIYRLALIVPIRRQTVALSDIVGVQVRKREYGEGGASYTSVLRLKRGESIKFACPTRGEAMSLKLE